MQTANILSLLALLALSPINLLALRLHKAAVVKMDTHFLDHQGRLEMEEFLVREGKCNQWLLTYRSLERNRIDTLVHYFLALSTLVLGSLLCLYCGPTIEAKLAAFLILMVNVCTLVNLPRLKAFPILSLDLLRTKQSTAIADGTS